MRFLCLSALLLSTCSFASNFAGPDQFICGTSTTMQAEQLANGETGFWSVAVGTATFITPSSPNSAVTGLTFGENVLRWTVFASSGQSSDLVAIWCFNNAMPVADAGADQTVDHWPGTTQLNGSATIAPGTCYWEVISGSATVAQPNNPISSISGLGAGTNVLQWNCDNGPCGSSSDQMVIDAVVGIGESAAPALPFRYDASQHALIVPPASKAMDLVILDAQGRHVQALRTPGGAGLWKLNALPSGIYTVLAPDHDRSALRFVVNR